jgi:hypothetical protein
LSFYGYFLLSVRIIFQYCFFCCLQVKIWFQNRRAKERRSLKKHEEAIIKEKLDPASAAAAAAAAAAAVNFGNQMSAFSDSFHHPATSISSGVAEYISSQPPMPPHPPPHSMPASFIGHGSMKFE